MGYNIVQTGLITPKKRGVMLMNKKYEVRGVYPIEAKLSPIVVVLSPIVVVLSSDCGREVP